MVDHEERDQTFLWFKLQPSCSLSADRNVGAVSSRIIEDVPCSSRSHKECSTRERVSFYIGVRHTGTRVNDCIFAERGNVSANGWSRNRRRPGQDDLLQVFFEADGHVPLQ